MGRGGGGGGLRRGLVWRSQGRARAVGLGLEGWIPI